MLRIEDFCDHAIPIPLVFIAHFSGSHQGFVKCKCNETEVTTSFKPIMVQHKDLF